MRHIDFSANNNVVRGDTLDFYLSQMHKSKTLGEGEIRNLIAEAQSGNLMARNKVVTANLRIVWSIAKAYNMDTFEDVLQNGNYGLIKAVETFDLSRGTMFSTWVLECVRKYIGIGLTDESRTVRMGAHFVKANSHYQQSSVDTPLSEEDGDKKTFLDMYDSGTRSDDLTDKSDMKMKIEHLMRGLDEREKTIVCGLFGIGCPEGMWTEYTLAKRFGLTEERVRQIKWETLKKMKEMA